MSLKSLALSTAIALAGPAATLTLATGPALAQDDTLSVETATGTAEVPRAPQTTAVYDMAALDTLDALGVEGLTSTDKTYFDGLADYQGDIGTLFEPDFEALNALQPDFIVVGGRSAPQAEAVADFAPTIDMTIEGTDLLNGLRARIEAYGRIWGKEDAAADLTADLDTALEDARAAGRDAGDALIVLTNGAKMSAYGAGSRFGWLHEATGIPEAVEGLSAAQHGESVSSEFIRDADPDWLFVIDRGAAIGADSQGAEATLDNPLVRETKAWQSDQVVYLGAADVYIASGGVQATRRTLKTVTEALTAAAGS
jgi:iron complex transport system substrate-binding protein